MKTIVVSDGGHRFVVLLREDVALPDLPVAQEPAHRRYVAWWRAQCQKRGISYPYRTAEPQGLRIIRRLLERHTFEELQELAVHFMLDHGARLRENPNHFSIFASLVETMQEELRDQT